LPATPAFTGTPFSALKSAHDYNPQVMVYLASCRALGLAPDEVITVAAHNNDLSSAPLSSRAPTNMGRANAPISRPLKTGIW